MCPCLVGFGFVFFSSDGYWENPPQTWLIQNGSNSNDKDKLTEKQFKSEAEKKSPGTMGDRLKGKNPS